MNNVPTLAYACSSLYLLLLFYVVGDPIQFLQCVFQFETLHYPWIPIVRSSFHFFSQRTVSLNKLPVHETIVLFFKSMSKYEISIWHTPCQLRANRAEKSNSHFPIEQRTGSSRLFGGTKINNMPNMASRKFSYIPKVICAA